MALRYLTTDSPRIWRQPWNSLENDCPTLNDWASGICFYREGGVRGKLTEVATATRHIGGGLDFVFRTAGGRIEGLTFGNKLQPVKLSVEEPK